MPKPNPDRYYLAMDTMAREMLARAAETIEWEDYPDIGENDWMDLMKRVKSLVPRYPADQVRLAYKLLEQRAEK